LRLISACFRFLRYADRFNQFTSDSVSIYNESMRNERNRSGFSLIEIIVVIGIMAILAGIGATSYSGYIQRGRDDRRIQDVEMLREALERFHSNQSGGFYPINATALVTGGYLQRRPADPLTNLQEAYLYTALPTGCNNTGVGNFCLDYTISVNLERRGFQYQVNSNAISGTIIP